MIRKSPCIPSAYFALASPYEKPHSFCVKFFGGVFLCSPVMMALLVIGTVAPLNAGDKKGKDVALTFHMQTEIESNPKMIINLDVAGKKCAFSQMADFSSRDVVAFSPFLGDDQNTFGVVFQLKDSAKNKLENLSLSNRGKYLLARFNGRLIDVVSIDQKVSDGMLVIWSGITDGEIKALDKMAPRIGEKKK